MVADLETCRHLIRYTREFSPDLEDIVIDIDNEIDVKLKIASFNTSQVYEWLPFTRHEVVPEGDEARFEWLKGMNITSETTEEEIMAAK